MKAIEIIKSKKHVFAIVGIAILAILLIFAGGMVAFYSGQAEAGDVWSGKAGDSIMAKALESIDPTTTEEAQEERAEEEQRSFDTTQGPSSELQGAEQSSNAPSFQSGPSASGPSATSGNKDGQASSPSSTPQKKWVEDTQQVWVEDKAAWTESVPVYGTKEVSICNVCGADITGNTSAHSKAHMLAGEGSGHHSEVRQVVTGHKTLNHPAEGHYETRVIGSHWE